jgi:hypothetical protein
MAILLKTKENGISWVGLKTRTFICLVRLALRRGADIVFSVLGGYKIGHGLVTKLGR